MYVPRSVFVQPMLQWKSNKNYICVCACVRVSVALGNQHAKRMSRIVVWGLSGSNIFLYYVMNGMIVGKSYEQKNMSFDFLYNFCLKSLSF